MGKRVMVAMSGGVDSAVASYLLVEQGYEVSGATLELFEPSDDAKDAKAIADSLGFSHIVIDYRAPFREEVVDRFTESYEKGETPNPCIDCNKHIKFGKLFKEARQLGNDFYATGHYARIEYDETASRYLLKKARDVSKDQTYVLYSLTQEELSHTLFPLGNLLKEEVIEIAKAQSLVDARKRESQDICFIKDGDYAGFLEKTMGITPVPGDFIDMEGKVIGTHSGIINYTPGQRRGLNISLGKRKYVTSIDAEKNTVSLGDLKDLYSDRLIAFSTNLISVERLEGPMEVKAKIRYSHEAAPATIRCVGNRRILVEFEEAQKAITPGQSVVFYDGDTVVGGGIISSEKNI
jgi:tRNA-specific 2-thiouridylase